MAKKRKKKRKELTFKDACGLLDCVTVGLQDLEANFLSLVEDFDQVKRDIGWLLSLRKEIEKFIEDVDIPE